MDALVTDVQHRAVVSGLRALGRSGLRVLAVAPVRHAGGLWSRYAARREIGPDPRSEPLAYTKAIQDVVRRHGAMVVYPGTEAAIEAVLTRWSSFGDGAVLPYAGPDSLRAVRDKRLLPEAAAAVGLRAPTTFMECTAEELARRSVPFPCMVKPANPAARPGGPHALTAPADLERTLRRLELPLDTTLLVQEWIRGQPTSVELVLSRDGEVVRRFQQVAARTSPASAGSISLATSVAADETLVERSAEMLRRVGYWGLAQLDFIHDADGPALIDVNPRFYACMPLALACGVNLASAWHQIALGDRPAAAPRDYRTGVTFRWLEGELVAAARGDLSRLRTLGRRPVVGPMWASDDPVAAGVLGVGAITLRAQRVLCRNPRDSSE